MTFINRQIRKIINYRNKKRLLNSDFSLIANNCNGAFICHDLGVRYNSPFVNLWIKPKDYLKLLNNLKYYLGLELEFIEEEDITYPIGLLGDVRIYFQHYSTCEEAFEKWMTRVKRMNYENLFVLLVERDGCTAEDLIEFDKLPFKYKVAFTHLKYDNLKCGFYISGYETEEYIGNCYEFVDLFSGRKYYDNFDYVSWFNSMKR